MTGLVIHGFPLSTYVRTVRLVCAEKAIAYDLNPVQPGEAKEQGLHPFGKIPAITEGDFQLYETLAITRYLDETRDGPALQARGAQARALTDQWISLINDLVYDAVVRRVVLQYVFPRGPDGQPDRNVIEAALPEILDLFAVLDQAVGEGSFLVDDRLTLADLFLGPILFYLALLPEGPALLRAAPNLQRAYGRLAARPSFAATEPDLPPAFGA